MTGAEIRTELPAKAPALRDHLPSCEVTIWPVSEKNEAE
jgi:hypothetical protein